MKKKKNSKKALITVLIVIGVFLVEAIVFMLVFNFSYDNNTDDAVQVMEHQTDTSTASATKPTSTNTEPTKQTDESSDTKPTQEQTEPEEPTTVAKAPEDLVTTLQSAGYKLEDLTAKQLVVVRSQGNSAVIDIYQANSNGLWSDMGMTAYGFVGQNGVDEKSVEGDYKTPYGLYPVGDMFYIDTYPQTGLNSFQVTDQTYWVDDPNSAYYNQRVEGTANMDWTSAEHMMSYYASYKYGFVIDYNVNPIVPGKGSAIFFHVGSAPTAGCVAVSESDMLSYLSVLDKNENPYILIV